MEMRGLFRGSNAKSAGSASVLADTRDAAVIGADERLAILDSLETSGTLWFWATDHNHNLIYLSEAAKKFFSPGQKILGQPIKHLFENVEQDEERSDNRPMTFLFGTKTKISELSVRVLCNDERKVWWSLTGKPHFDESGNFIGYRGSGSDISNSFAESSESARMAQFDSLTGLANRHRIVSRLAKMITQFEVSKRFCGLIMLDLDRFKQVNDALGHPAGDELLRQVAKRLERIVPQTAEIGRLGGDEFQILLPDCDDRERLGDLSHRIIQMISQPYSIKGSRANIGTSVGIAVYPHDGATPDDLVKAADLALYASKSGGRGQYRFYSSELEESAQDHRAIEEDLRDAMDAQQLEMYYQPMVCSKTEQVKCFEAVMRWKHPERGYISPAVFVPIAEETDLILKLGEWSMRQACLDAARWPEGINVSINVSAHQFRQDHLPDIVSNAMTSADLDPSRVELEITETVFIGDKSAAEAMFKRLKALGVRLALDDFGTGYSSLGYLRGAPFHKIKIDKSFVDEITLPNDSSRAIAAAIVALAKALDMKTTAEGVEAMDQLTCVQELGADFIQGYIYSKPIAQADVLALLDAGKLAFEARGPKCHRPKRISMYRRISAIHEDHRYDVVLRNLSRTGAMIEGILNVPEGTDLVIDFGGGQLAIAKVQRSMDARQGVRFENPLISDGADGLCTRYRVPPYVMEATEKRLRMEKGISQPAFIQASLQAGAPPEG